ncbi:MAG TPA: imidazoleglycerol-phosphate dehydratase HisB, partial [Bacteroidota bacterium]|nr:imidazoleglycerol-phosphate dehydratase HisB [Bacteroidota bacterium]
LGGEGVHFDKIFICPHRPNDHCDCRKPKIGLLKNYLRTNTIDWLNSFVLGDRNTDIELALNLGARGIHLLANKNTKAHPGAEFSTSSGVQACEYIFRSSRMAAINRKTNETAISACVALGGTGVYNIATGIGFFDHLLSQLSRHSRIDIDLRVKGDLEIDEHHTVEDTGIVLGEAIRKAMGTKKGIARFGFAAPLDEALAEVVLDFSGRRHLSFDCSFKRERVGDFPTELAADFFAAFADGLMATLHIRCKGRNEHHKLEAIFKATAVALRHAVQIDRRALKSLPTTKGIL